MRLIPLLNRCAQAVWTADPHLRIRLQQWSLAALIYVIGAGFLTVLSTLQVIAAPHLLTLVSFNFSGLLLIYVAIRSGWSKRFADPALTQAQMLFGVANVIWCYVISMQVRGAMLYPLMLIFTFGAFSMQWRRIVLLTVVALISVGVAMASLHRLMPGVLDPVVDLANFLMVSIMLAGTSAVAATLGQLRQKLRTQRAQLFEALERIQDLASRDALTGLFNRRHGDVALQAELDRSTRSGQAFSIALLDLDHFKTINDRYGHGAGDEVLKSFADIGSGRMRSIDTLARWGGEEFLVVMPNTPQAGALIAMERLRIAVAKSPLVAADALITFTLSGGVSEFQPGDNAADLLQRADTALYEAKAAGRNRITTAQPTPARPSLRAHRDAVATGAALIQPQAQSQLHALAQPQDQPLTQPG